MRTTPRSALVGLFASWLTAAPSLAQATAPSSTPESEVRDEARQRFDRGLSLYNAGDAMGAMAEFQLAYDLTGHPVVLYNLALVRASLGFAAEALDALEQLETPEVSAVLGPERTAKAQQVRDELQPRVGRLDLRISVPGAKIEIDNVDVATSPTPPIRVTAGQHIVAILAPGYDPERHRVLVAGESTRVLEVALQPLDQNLAHLKLWTGVPDVEIRVAGGIVGYTPLATELAFKPGSYAVDLRRGGYEPVARTLKLEPNATAELAIPLVPTTEGLSSGGTLKFDISETEAVVTIDGIATLVPADGLRVPAGRHAVGVQRAGFFDVTRMVAVEPKQRRTVDITLLPTPQYLEAYVRHAQRRRTWSYVSMGIGSAFVAGSSVFLAWNATQKRDAEAAFDAYADEVEAMPGARCANDLCDQTLAILVDDLEAKRQRDIYGWIGLGLGASVLTTGILLYALGKDPKRYDPSPASDVLPSLSLGWGVGTISVSGRFGSSAAQADPRTSRYTSSIARQIARRL